MQVFEFVLCILAIVFGARLIRDYLRYRSDARPVASDDDTRMLGEEVARLRDRIQVLERVITDNHGSLDLDRQIERLRDR